MQETRKAVKGDCIELISVVAYKTFTGLVMAKTGERFHVKERNRSDDGVKTMEGVNVLDTEYKIVDEAQEPSEQTIKVKYLVKGTGKKGKDVQELQTYLADVAVRLREIADTTADMETDEELRGVLEEMEEWI